MGKERNVLDFAFCSDFEYYEKYLSDLTLEEQAAFMEKFPEFLDEKDNDVIIDRGQR